MESLWTDLVVKNDSLVQCVGDLRSQLCDQGAKLITTLQRRGYMFEADVRPVAPNEPGHFAPTRGTPVAPPTVPAASSTRHGKRGLAAAVALAAFAIAGGALYVRSRPAPLRIDEEIARRHSIYRSCELIIAAQVPHLRDHRAGKAGSPDACGLAPSQAAYLT